MSEEWYYSRDQEQYGPFLFDDLAEMAEKEVIAKTDLLWNESMDEWRVAESIDGLFDQPTAPAASGYVSPFAQQASLPDAVVPPVQSPNPADANQYAAPQTTQTAAPVKKKSGSDFWYLSGGCLIHIVLVIIGLVIAIIEIILEG